MAFIRLVISLLLCSALIVSGSETRKLDETVPGAEKCTPCVQAPPPPPPPAPCPPPPALPPPAPKKPPSKYCPPPPQPPPPPSSYIYITGPPGSLYPIDQDLNGASLSPGGRLELAFLIALGLLGLLGFW